MAHKEAASLTDAESTPKKIVNKSPRARFRAFREKYAVAFIGVGGAVVAALIITHCGSDRNIVKLAADVATMTEDVAMIGETVGDLQESLGEQGTALASLSTTVISLGTTVASIEERFDGLEEDVNGLRREVRSIHDDVGELREDLIVVRENVARMEGYLERPRADSVSGEKLADPGSNSW